LAHILIRQGIKVSGSDRTESSILDILKKDGAAIYIGQSAENITNPDLVVYTAAISSDNPELCEARKKGIKTLERAEFLGNLMLDYKFPVSISGTHGKTTTTSMLSNVLLEANKEPTVLVGGEFDKIGGNYYIGQKNYLIFEGCEYVDSFLHFNPYAALILNIEEDHLDYFSGIEQIKLSFNKFMKKIPADGFVVINADDKNILDSLEGIKCQIVKYGRNGDFSAENIEYDKNGFGIFDVLKKGKKIARIHLSVGGKHNISNSLAVFAAADKMDIGIDSIIRGIQGYKGTRRRFEYKGTVNGAKVYDDYAHHPTEIAATFNTASKMEHNRIWVVFQPHTYSRTNALLDDFVSVLSKFDNVIVTDIYAAREKNTIGISAKCISDKIKNALYISDFKEISEHIKSNVQKSDIVITMGAGTITDLSKFLFDIDK
ncbi:MAG: UDP-N-acetylmuramate--L-alanine ligase, partial [Clostridia bacterium]|nr:UDP-N-acetylmuramate--L-alanine ligase [Clostridia bacterium]